MVTILAVAGFVCLYYGNTGSSWLLSALASSREVFMTGFESVERWAWDVPVEERLAWLETAMTPPEDRTGSEFEYWFESLRASPQVKQEPMNPNFTYTCLKMADLPVEDTDGVIDVIDGTGAKAIHLVRNNRLKHALSLYRYHDEQKSQFHGKDEYPPTKVNFVKFEKWLEESARLHEQAMGVREECMERLGPERVFPLAYEEFLDEPAKNDVLDRLAAFFDIPAEFAEGKFTKATPDSLREAISNYKTFRLRYRFTPHAKYLD
jgi:hypothetical protein